jgi:C4-dicarboxylate transporter DctM subunit
MPLIILGGLLSGVFTPTEAGAIAVLYAFIIGFATGNIKIKDLKSIFYNAAIATTIPMLIIGIAAIFGWLLTINNFPSLIGGVLQGITRDPNVFIIIIVAFLLFLGLFMESNAALIIMVPVLAPMAASYGFYPVHFGVVMVITLLIGAVTPPVGILLFISTSLAKAKIGDVMWLVWPYVILLSILALIFALVPPLVTWLPGLVMR